jgi:hypothetical protein
MSLVAMRENLAIIPPAKHQKNCPISIWRRIFTYIFTGSIVRSPALTPKLKYELTRLYRFQRFLRNDLNLDFCPKSPGSSRPRVKIGYEATI